MAETFYWYDFETFGTDPFRDRPVQFAGVRTDTDLNPVGEPLVLFAKPADDCLPQPQACLVTGITPQRAIAEGISEAEFIARIHAEFSQPHTCVLGYNTLRFDDEVTRNTLYRNFYDPYGREWQNGNSRWDMIDLVRLARAVRPEGIRWPDHADGKPSFRLEDLTAANGIAHEGAHDAMVDVWATIELARLLKQRQPKLYDYLYSLRDKHKAEQLLNPAAPKPLLHVSSKYPADKGCAAIVTPLARDKLNKNAIYVFDLGSSPEALLTLSIEQIRERIFTAAKDLPEGVERIPLKAVHINKCPALAPVKVVTPEIAERLGINMVRCEQHFAALSAHPELKEKVAEVFATNRFQDTKDPDLMLYSGGFFSDRDRRLMEDIQACDAAALAQRDWPFHDQRLPEMLFRYRARNFPASLNEAEREAWQEYRRYRLSDPDGGGSITLGQYFSEIEELLRDEQDPARRNILERLKAYGLELSADLAPDSPERG